MSRAVVSSTSQPIFPVRMQALTTSVVRGEKLYVRRCAKCHDPAAIAPSAMTFPRVVGGRPQSLEGFLEGHQSLRHPLAWDGAATADVIAYLISRVAGRPIGLQTYQASKEVREGS